MNVKDNHHTIHLRLFSPIGGMRGYPKFRNLPIERHFP